ncbi:MAG: hypothetical protein L0312_29875, partial [Acidobacteria bacterium]|nr:hypothetical protein [Acidobacteriota bacterium]
VTVVMTSDSVWAGAVPQRQRWQPVKWMVFDDHPRARCHLAGANVRNTIHSGQAVRAITSKTETAYSGGSPPRP